MRKLFKIQVSDDRAMSVLKDIATGSEPEVRFYAMVAASTAIATFGLIKSSTAIVIGAMLVAPLMTPIFGIALALVRGDAILLGRSIRAEIAGIVLTMGLAACFGYLMPELEATPEMLDRTTPNLLDLLVAVFAGFAGAYAMVDEHISPALPGVAIATAIVPPLANAGLCISLGAYQGAAGSFLLFFANFLSILLVAASIFFAAGMRRDFGSVTKKDVVRRFGLAIIGFCLVAAFLSKGLYEIVQTTRLKNSIYSVLSEELSHLPATDLQDVINQTQEDNVFVLARVNSPTDISPHRVKKIEEALEKEIAMPIELFVRTTVTRDVSATGSINQVIAETLDGFSYSHKPDPKVKILKLAEQTIREHLASILGLYVEEINLLKIKEKQAILATVFGVRKLSPDEIKDIETRIQARTGNNDLILVIRYIRTELNDRWGTARYEWTWFESISPEQESLLDKLDKFLHESFKDSVFSLIDLNFTLRKGMYHVLVDLFGPRLYSQKELAELKKKLSEIAKTEVKVYVRSRPEDVVTEDGYTSLDALQMKFLKQTEELYQKEIKEIVEERL
jgi:uncharacterized hydrophobic protein (TIGR00271 family)